MMPRRIVVHIGLAKASSTTLQASLAALREPLRARGIDYPVIGGGGVKDQKPLRLAVRGNGREAAEGGAAVAAALASAAERGMHTVVFSGETLHAGDPARLRALLDHGPFAGAPVTAMAIVRDAASWLNSRYAFEALLFRRTERFSGFATRSLRRAEADLIAALARWMAPAVDRFVAVPLAARGDTRSVVARALEAVGLEPALQPAAITAHKTAADPRTVEAARRLALLGLAGSRGPQLRKAQRLLTLAADEAGWYGRFSGLEPTIARKIAGRTSLAADRLAALAWGTNWDAVYATPDPAAYVSNELLDPTPEEEAAVRAVVDGVARELTLRPRGVLGWCRGGPRAPRRAAG